MELKKIVGRFEEAGVRIDNVIGKSVGWPRKNLHLSMQTLANV